MQFPRYFPEHKYLALGLLAAIGLAAGPVMSASAAAFEWDDGGADSHWGTPKNWVSDSAPSTTGGDTVEWISQLDTLEGSSQHATVAQDYHVDGVIFDYGYHSGSTNVNLTINSGKTLTIAASGGGTLQAYNSSDGDNGEGTVLGSGTLQLGNTSNPGNILAQEGDGGDPRGTIHIESNVNAVDLDTVTVASLSGAFRSSYNAIGTLDMQNATLTGGTMNVDTRINMVAPQDAPSSWPDAEYALATMSLPSGTVNTPELFVGRDNHATRVDADLDLHGTIVAVSTEARVQAVDDGTDDTDSGGSNGDEQSVLTTHVPGTGNAGLDLASGAVLNVNSEGLIDIIFEGEKTTGALHWGLRWGGSHSTNLQNLQSNGQLTIDDSAISPTASIFEQDGTTYVGYVVPEPSAAALLTLGCLTLLGGRRRRCA